jgi:hypothetical protein
MQWITNFMLLTPMLLGIMVPVGTSSTNNACLAVVAVTSTKVMSLAVFVASGS